MLRTICIVSLLAVATLAISLPAAQAAVPTPNGEGIISVL
jgi:hypothetical protein